MACTEVTTNPSPSNWQAGLPAFWLPALFYFEFSATLRFAFEIHNHFDLGVFCFCVRIVPVALVAMLRAGVRVRVLAMAALMAIDIAFELVALIFDDRSLPLVGFLHELARLGLRDLWAIGVVGAVSHGLTSFLGVFASSREPSEFERTQSMQSRISDWLYFMTLIGLCFLPSLPEWQPPPEPGDLPSVKGVLFVEIGNAILASLVCGVPICGVYILSKRISWRFRFCLLTLLFAVGLGVSGYLFMTLEPKFNLSKFDLGREFTIALYSIVLALTSVPFWLFVRAAGYRVYSPRKWIGCGTTIE